ncbi:hypothetical protein [Streptomyces sp. NPDC002994]|uniref:hypothetical protein n=1 Tax=Streptomyces sp. NPDC002994 TaxID=3154441 RepID=UPI0033A02F94
MGVRPSTRTRTRLLTAGALLLVVHAGGWPLAADPPRAAADGVGSHALALSVTVNTRPGREAEHTGIRVGHPVVKHYRLTNRSGADLHRLRLTDPHVPGAAVNCPGGRGLWLRGLTSVTCTSLVSATPGRHTSTVRAHAEIPSLGARPSASAVAGYEGVAGALRLAVTVREVEGSRAVVQYTVGNPGNRTVFGVRLSDTALNPPRIICGGRPASSPQTLPAGATVLCVAELDGLRPGTYHSGPEARGSDGLFTLDTAGGLVGPPPLVARAATRFTVRAQPPPESPRPARPAPPPAQAPLPAPGPPPGGASLPGGASPLDRAAPQAPSPGGGAGTPGAPGAPAAAPGGGAPGGGAPGGPAAPAGPAPGTLGAPGLGVPGLGVPGLGVPGLGVPGLGVPGLGASGLGVPGLGLGVPGLGAPGLGAPAPGLGIPGLGAGEAAGVAPPPPAAEGIAPPPPGERATRPNTPRAPADNQSVAARRAGGVPRREDPLPVVAVLLLLLIPAGIVAVVASRRT